MTKVLVTGGAGFIGANLCIKLLKHGSKVIAVDNLITSDGTNLKLFDKNKNFLFFKHDISLPFPKNLLGKLKNIDYIYHLACPTGVPNIAKFSEEMLKTCSYGTINVLEVAKKNNVKLIFTSSSEVYGNPKEFPQKESYTGNVSPTGFRSPYEEGKRFSESLVKMYANKYEVDAKIIRVFNTYGSYSSKNETRVIPRFLRLAGKNEPLPVEGNGRQTRTFCYVDDLVNGLMLIMKKGKKGEVYNLGGNKEIKIKDLAKSIIKITNSKSKIISVVRPIHDHNRRHPDLAKIYSLGWKPKISLEKGLKEIIKHYK